MWDRRRVILCELSVETGGMAFGGCSCKTTGIAKRYNFLSGGLTRTGFEPGSTMSLLLHLDQAHWFNCKVLAGM